MPFYGEKFSMHYEREHLTESMFFIFFALILLNTPSRFYVDCKKAMKEKLKKYIIGFGLL